jgi:hypothetical protein
MKSKSLGLVGYIRDIKLVRNIWIITEQDWELVMLLLGTVCASFPALLSRSPNS